MKKHMSLSDKIWFVLLSVLSVAWIYPVVMILINSLKMDTAISTDSVFELPTVETFAGLANYINAILWKKKMQ